MVYVIRRVYKLENYITDLHFDRLGKFLALTCLIYLYFNINEYLIPEFTSKKEEIRITSYNVCYTKLLRLTSFVAAAYHYRYTAGNMTILYETTKLILESKDEIACLKEKATGMVLFEDCFYGNPECGLIDEFNNWALVRNNFV